MRLKVLLPTEILVDEEVNKVCAEADNGSFCMLPRHIDFVTALIPGILSFDSKDGREVFLAVDEGILVKRGPEVLASTRNAVLGPDLGLLRQTVEKQFQMLDEHETANRTAFARLEADLVRRFIEMDQSRHA